MCRVPGAEVRHRESAPESKPLWTPPRRRRGEEKVHPACRIDSEAMAAAIAPPEGYTTLSEGSATVLYKKKNEVFYNNVQVFNRDLSVMVCGMVLEQREAEAQDQEARKAAKKPGWRRIPATWSHWLAGQQGRPDPAVFKSMTRSCNPQTSKVAKQDSAAATVNQVAATSAASARKPSPYDPVSDFLVDPATDWEACVREKVAGGDGALVLEALSATGLRSVRYFKEVPGIKTLLVNDIEEAAVDHIRQNIEFNGLDPLRCVPNQGDCNNVMHKYRAEGKLFDIIDLDPYGTAAPFLDAAIQSVADGGLLCVTCTDLAVLSGGGQRDKCFAKYGAIPAKAAYCHEMSVRIVLGTMERIATRFGRHIVPLFSARIDFYVRMFVRVYSSGAEVKKSATRLSHVFQCVDCDSFRTSPILIRQGNRNIVGRAPACGASKCPDCGGAIGVAGPIWNRPIINRAFCNEVLLRLSKPELVAKHYPHLTTIERIRGEMSKALEEVPHAPLFYGVSQLTMRLHCQPIPMAVIFAAVQSCGYDVSNAAANPNSLKTDAPPGVVWDIMRRWVEKYPLSGKRRKETNTVGHRILSKKATIECSFDGAAKMKSMRTNAHSGIVRYQANPEPNWGPKSRATGKRRKVA